MRNPAACALVWLAVACSSVDVGVDRDPDYDFTGKETFAWKEGVPARNELHQKRIVTHVESELTARGLRPATGGAPDLWVATEVGGHREVRSTGGDVSVGIGRSVGWGSVGLGTSTGNRIYEVDVGELVIVVLDGPSEEVVWRAQAQGTVSDDPQKTAEAIEKTVAKAFEDFPVGAPAE